MATRKVQKTQKDRMITAFKSGYDFTVGQLCSRINASDSTVRRLISELRLDGYAIYKNKKNFATGNTGFVYRLGTPSRAMVKLAAAVGGPELFS